MQTILEPVTAHMMSKPFDPIPTRHSLLERLKDWGDQTSWQEFFDSYSELIYNVAVKAGLSDADAQEVVQETVFTVARKIAEFKADPARGSFSAWLMQLTRWRITDRWRKRLAEPGHGPGGGERNKTGSSDDAGSTGTVERIPDSSSAELETIWQEEWEKHLMTVALERVKEQASARQYQMFDLHVLQQVPVRVAASTLQTSVASVYMAKHRLGALLKKEIKKLQDSQ